MAAWRLTNTYANYTPQDVLKILEEEYRLLSFVDIEVDEGLEMSGDITVYEWRSRMDFLPWRKLYQAQNKKFKIELPYETWMEAVEPEEKRTLWDMCVFIAQHARKEIIRPIRLFGRDCLGAAVFLTLKKNLSATGIDVDDLRPSTPLRGLLDARRFPCVLAEIVMAGTRTFEVLKLKLRSDISFWRKMNLFARDRYYVDTGSIRTFGDLAKKIAESLPEDG
jgi:hypothetical protein